MTKIKDESIIEIKPKEKSSIESDSEPEPELIIQGDGDDVDDEDENIKPSEKNDPDQSVKKVIEDIDKANNEYEDFKKSESNKTSYYTTIFSSDDDTKLKGFVLTMPLNSIQTFYDTALKQEQDIISDAFKGKVDNKRIKDQIEHYTKVIPLIIDRLNPKIKEQAAGIDQLKELLENYKSLKGEPEEIAREFLAKKLSDKLHNNYVNLWLSGVNEKRDYKLFAPEKIKDIDTSTLSKMYNYIVKELENNSSLNQIGVWQYGIEGDNIEISGKVEKIIDNIFKNIEQDLRYAVIKNFDTKIPMNKVEEFDNLLKNTIKNDIKKISTSSKDQSIAEKYADLLDKINRDKYGVKLRNYFNMYYLPELAGNTRADVLINVIISDMLDGNSDLIKKAKTKKSDEEKKKLDKEKEKLDKEEKEELERKKALYETVNKLINSYEGKPNDNISELDSKALNNLLDKINSDKKVSITKKLSDFLNSRKDDFRSNLNTIRKYISLGDGGYDQFKIYIANKLKDVEGAVLTQLAFMTLNAEREKDVDMLILYYK